MNFIFHIILMMPALTLAAPQNEAEPHVSKFSLPEDFEYSVEFGDAGLGDKLASIDAQAAFDNFFNVTGVATTPLGSVTAFVGDVAYPLFVGFALAAGFYVFLQVAFQVLTFVLGGKLTVVNSLVASLLGFLQAAQEGVFSKVVSISTLEDEDAADAGRKVAAIVRQARNAGFPTQGQLVQLASMVADAIDKYH